MTDTTPCPDADRLGRLLLGELTPADLDPLGEHVLRCERCVNTLAALRPDDALLRTLRGADTVASLPPLVLSLIARLSGLPEGVPQGAAVPAAPDRAPAEAAGAPASVRQGLRGERRPVSPEEIRTDRSQPPGEERRRLDTMPAGHGLCDTQTSPPPAAPPSDREAPAAAVLRPPEAADELGRLGGYRVLRLLGQGGMGAVFLAEDPHLERKVALKVMGPGVAALPEARQRFLREAKATAKIKNDNVIAIYQVGEDNGVPFLAMEYLRGESLEGWLRRGKPLSAGQLLRMARDVTRGLAAAHEKGLVHRDIKPANLWLEAPRGRVKILDFGLARGGVEEVQLTQSGAILGTPAYMSPEQARGEPADARSDLFSLGCVLYRLCTGVSPFHGRTVMAVLTALATDEPVPVRQKNPQIPQALADLVMRLLAKRREDRPASAGAVLQELQALERQRALAPTTVARPPSAEAAPGPPAPATPEARRRRPRRRLLAAAALLGVAGAAVLGGVVIRITGKDGKQTEITAPEGSKITVNEKGEVDIKLPGAEEKSAAAVPAAGSPLDRLDPARIPAAERFDWQPRELVAVLGEHRQRHWGSAQSVAVSADGKRFATSGTDGLVRLWDAATCREQGAVRVGAPGDYVAGLAFSPDNKRLAFCSGGIGFCDVSATAPVREKGVLECAYIALHLAFAPDRGRLFGVDECGTLFVWDATGVRTKPLLKREGCKVTACNRPFDLSRDGRKLAFRSGERAVSLLDVSGADVRELAVLPQPEPVWSVALSPDGKRLAAGFQGGKVRVWDVSRNEPAVTATLQFGAEPVEMRFSPDGKRLAVAYTSIRLWGVEGPEPTGGGTFGVCLGSSNYYDLAFTPDGKTMCAVNGDGTVRFWDVAGETPRERSLIEPPTYLRGYPYGCQLPLALTKDGKRVATAHPDGTRWWDFGGASPAPGRSLESCTPLAMDARGKTLLLVGPPGWALWRWDLSANVPRSANAQDESGQEFCTARLFPDGRTIAVGTRGGEVRIRERTGAGAVTERCRFKAGEGRVAFLEVSPDGRVLATATDSDRVIKLWDVSGQKPEPRGVINEGPQLYQVAFSLDGRTLAVSTIAATSVWDLQERQPRRTAKWESNAEVGHWRTVAFSPDGRTLALATQQGKLILRHLETGAPRKEWQLPGPVSWVAYAPDGRHLLTVNGNGTGYVLRLAPPPAAEAPPK